MNTNLFSSLLLIAMTCIACTGAAQQEPQAVSAAEPPLVEEVQYVHMPGTPHRGHILMVVSSPAVSEQTGWPIGFWAAELTHPLHVFQQAGYEVTVASTAGGELMMDSYSDPTHESGYSADDVITLGYMQQDWFRSLMAETPKFSELAAADYDAIFLVGGQGPMYTFRGNQALGEFFVAFYEAGKPSASVCHATALLLEAQTSDGALLVEGKTWTGFANAEEKYADQAVGQKIQPYWIETEASKLESTTFKVADPFSSHVIQDGHLITGQQQHSGAAAARLLVQALAQN